jgi:hypothetical protein
LRNAYPFAFPSPFPRLNFFALDLRPCRRSTCAGAARGAHRLPAAMLTGSDKRSSRLDKM